MRLQVKDDPELLKKTIHKKEVKKQKSKTEWKDRKQHTDQKLQQKLKKRNENINKRVQDKKKKKMKSLSKRGRVIPGF